MIKAIKNTILRTEIELQTPFFYKYVGKRGTYTMVGMVTDTSIFEITLKQLDNKFFAYEITINHNIDKDDILPYMYENEISKEEFENYYFNTMAKINTEFSIPIKEEL